MTVFNKYVLFMHVGENRCLFVSDKKFKTSRLENFSLNFALIYTE